jgi:dihydroflavonol-4-reductase
MKTLVTGASGLLGANLVRELLRRGHEVRALLRGPDVPGTLSGLDLEHIEGNLLDEESLKRACRGVDFVIHAAGKIAGNQVQFCDYAAINLKGTQNIVRAAGHAGVRRMVHVSSCCVFSGGSKAHPGTELSEFTGFRFNSGYINSKYLAQQWVLTEVEKKKFPVVIVNPTLLLGPYDAGPSSGEAILRVLQQPLQFCPEGGKNFIDVRDAAYATCNALSMGIPGECYILASENLSFMDFYEKVNRIYGSNGFRVPVPGPFLKGAGLLGNIFRAFSGHDVPLNLVNARQLTMESYFSAAKAVRVLNLPQRPVDEAIRDAISWFVANGYLAPKALRESPVPSAA